MEARFKSWFGGYSPAQIGTIMAAEILGTAILVFLGCMGLLTGFVPEIQTDVQISLTFGFAVSTSIQVVGHISKCHINPAVTLCAVFLGQINVPTGIVYVLSQCVGSSLGYGLLKALTPHTIWKGPSCCSECVTVPHASLSSFQAMIVESAATAVLIFVVCGVWDKRCEEGIHTGSIKFGITIAAICLAEAHYTGCSLNPARSFGPALWNNVWQYHWVYWVGPLLGSALATLFYMFVLTTDMTKEGDGNLADA